VLVFGFWLLAFYSEYRLLTSDPPGGRHFAPLPTFFYIKILPIFILYFLLINNNLKVFVTGADGFLGSNIVRVLLERGEQVRAFIQKGRDTGTLTDLPIEKTEGDLLDLKDVEAAMKGCDHVIHAAANTSIWPTRSHIVRQVNIQGTKNIIQAVKSNDIKKMIYIGTANSFGAGTKQNPGDESCKFNAAKYKLDYIDSKYESHKIILNAIKEDNINAVIVNPTFMIGEYDSKPGSGALILALYNNKVPGCTNGGRNFINVKDAAIGTCNALKMGRKGESYILGNENLSYAEFNDLVCTELDANAVHRRIPHIFIYLYGYISEFISFFTRSEPVVSVAVARVSTDNNYYISTKAINELELPQTPVRNAIREAFDWYVKNDMV